MVKIAFWDNCLCERGTSIALFDYAFYNKKLLNNESIILYNNTYKSNFEVIQKFKKEFNVFDVDDFNKVDNILQEQNCDILYIIKSGENDNKISKVIKTVVHCVFK